jgi:transcription initiation factor TFIIIB Brf1 subunit/transcription initiation factor TFIIB
LKCPDCGGSIVYPNGLEGEKSCSACGLVAEEMSTFEVYTHWAPEWNSNWTEQDSETLKEWLTTLRAVSCQLNVPNFPFREEVARTIRKQYHLLAKSQRLSKNKRATVAGLIHLTLKEYNKMRPIKEISKGLSIDQRTVTKQTWLLSKTLDDGKKTLKIPRKTSIAYLYEYAGKMATNKELVNAERILINLRRAGGNPVGLAAGAFYLVCKKNKTKISKEAIGQAFHISERTVYANEVRIRKFSKAALILN